MKPRSKALAKAAAFDATTGLYPNQRALGDPWVSQMRDLGAAFWNKRGVNVPAGVPLYSASDLKAQDSDPYSVNGRGFAQHEPGGGRLVLLDRNTNTLLGRARNRKLSTRMRRQAFGSLGQLVTHELGHVGGLPHEEAGVMNETITPGDATPWDMRLLARRLIPRQRQRSLGRSSSGIDG